MMLGNSRVGSPSPLTVAKRLFNVSGGTEGSSKGKPEGIGDLHCYGSFEKPLTKNKNSFIMEKRE